MENRFPGNFWSEICFREILPDMVLQGRLQLITLVFHKGTLNIFEENKNSKSIKSSKIW
jgi:hypothetical protein